MPCVSVTPFFDSLPPPPSWLTTCKDSYKQNTTVWLLILWLIIFLLTAGLLIGFLVPWHKSSTPSFQSLGPVASTGGPLGSFSFTFSIDHSADVYYVIGTLSVQLGQSRWVARVGE